MQPELCYRVGGKIFDTADEAEDYIQKAKKIEDAIETTIKLIQEKKKERKTQIEREYEGLGLSFDQCRCKWGDYSENCLKHLCTCDLLDGAYPEKEYNIYVCNYHTNAHFRNKGCYWCRLRDCSKWEC